VKFIIVVPDPTATYQWFHDGVTIAGAFRGDGDIRRQTGKSEELSEREPDSRREAAEDVRAEDVRAEDVRAEDVRARGRRHLTLMTDEPPPTAIPDGNFHRAEFHQRAQKSRDPEVAA
jgi:hypothetical protein